MLASEQVYILMSFDCSETILFLHQIFLQGLQNRMESWPTLILGEQW